MNVYRYINNTAEDIVSGAYLVPAYDQLIFKEAQPVLDALVNKTLVGLINGIQVGQEIKTYPSEPQELELHVKEPQPAPVKQVASAKAAEPVPEPKP